ncbi:MAG: hypothetical protein HQ558_03650 [Candidatus Omnitrophica bacterium]|nr:hypothetical protein [Candidatus Omnitrophota bacterium]
MRLLSQVITVFLIAALFTGCGYTTRSLLPAHIKNIYIADFPNRIPITDEVSDRHRYKTYYPRLEIDVTDAIRDKFLFDGYLKVSQKQYANVILEGSLVDFRREPVKYDYDDNVEQYRIVIMVDMKYTDVKENKVMWQEKGFAGSAYFYTSGPQYESEQSAIVKAISDLARRVVDRTIDVW